MLPAPPKYLKQKTSELKCLSGFISDRTRRDRIRKELVLRSYDDVFQAKISIRNEILTSRAPALLGESNFKTFGKPFECQGFQLSYDYMRADFKVLSKDHLSEIYPGLRAPSGTRTFGVFTSSGQAAISIGLDVLEDIYPGIRLSFPSGAYFETIDGLNLRKKRGNARGDWTKSLALFLDTSTQDCLSDIELDDAIKEAKVVLVDTTCRPLNCPSLMNIIRGGARHKKPVILFRSHLKLDCMATEYSRLGSIVLIDPQSRGKSAEIFLDSFKEKFSMRCRLYCGFPALQQIYPFFKSTTFQEISQNWIDRVKKQNEVVVDSLIQHWESKDVPFRLQKFGHGLYFWVAFKVPIAREEFPRFGKCLIKCLTWSQVPHRATPSYPWDFLAITHLLRGQKFSSDQAATFPITRISVPDFDDQLTENVIRGLNEWLRFLQMEL